jgi:hypothetical protein
VQDAKDEQQNIRSRITRATLTELKLLILNTTDTTLMALRRLFNFCQDLVGLPPITLAAMFDILQKGTFKRYLTINFDFHNIFPKKAKQLIDLLKYERVPTQLKFFYEYIKSGCVLAIGLVQGVLNESKIDQGMTRTRRGWSELRVKSLMMRNHKMVPSAMYHATIS